MKPHVLALLLMIPGLSAAQAFEAPLLPAQSGNAYPAIEFMSAGESAPLPGSAAGEDAAPATPQAQALRVVVYRAEIYQSVAIETLTTGLEGCCARVAARRAFDLAAFARHFGFKGEVSGFAFAGWASPRSFRFTYRGKPFRARVVDAGRILVEPDTARASGARAVIGRRA